MDAVFVTKNGNVYLRLSERFLRFHEGRVVGNKKIGPGWGQEAEGGWREMQIAAKEMVKNQVKAIAATSKIVMLQSGEAILQEGKAVIPSDDCVLGFDYGETNLVIVSEKTLTANPVWFLGEETDWNWGFIPAVYSSLESIIFPDGCRVKCSSRSYEEIQEEYDNAFKKSYEILNLETNETMILTDLRTWLPAPNSGYVVKNLSTLDNALVLVSESFLQRNEGKVLGSRISPTWGWAAESSYVYPRTEWMKPLLKAGFRGWFVGHDKIAGVVEQYHTAGIHIINLETGTTHSGLKDFEPFRGAYIVSRDGNDEAVIIAHKQWIEENRGTTLEHEVEGLSWGWKIKEDSWAWEEDKWIHELFELLSSNWVGWWVEKCDIPKIIEEYKESKTSLTEVIL